MIATLPNTALAANWNDPDLPYGWAGEWTCVNTMGFDAHFQLYKDVTLWIEQYINRPYNNAKWIKIGDCIYVQFRKQKDMNWFLLRFGHESRTV